MFQTAYSVEIKQENEEAKEYGTPKRDFVPFLPEIYALSYNTEEFKLKLSDLHGFSTAQTADNQCRLVAATIQHQNRRTCTTSMLYS